MIRHIFLYCCFIFFLIPGAIAQTWNYSFFKEKVYLHTNHVFFQPGDNVYYKIYLVNAQTQQPSIASKVVYVEVLNPSGNVIKKQTYKTDEGYAEGSYEFGVNDVGGIYKLRAYTSLMRNENDSTFFMKELTLQKVISPRILMKLEFPKKGYGAGDEVIASFSVRSLDNKPLAHHLVNYDVAIAGKNYLSKIDSSDVDGKLNLRFNLPQTLITNDGLLNITVKHDGFTESVSRSIPIVLNNIDLQLLPEGGTLVAGLPANIAFKAVNEFGKPADVSGEVINKNGKTVASFISYYGGMGQFNFTPQSNEQYTVKITRPQGISKSYAFPAFSPNGMVMQWQQENTTLKLTIHSTLDQEVSLVGTLKDKEYLRRNLTIKKGTQAFDLDATAFPAGIARFTLQTGKGLPLAERLVFVNQHTTLQVKVTPDKQSYLPREKVRLSVSTTDEHGKPVPSNLSLSVVDDKLWTYADDKQDHILSWLLMSSELNGHIDDPGFYFRSNEPKAKPALDLIMLTQGYRYFDYTADVLKDKTLKFFPDENRVISGIITNKHNVPVKGEVFLINLSNKTKALKLTTKNNGAFYFPNLNWADRYYLIASAVGRKESVSIQLTLNGFGPGINFIDKDKYVVVAKEMPELQKSQLDKWMDNFGKNDKRLEEVVVVGYGVVKKNDLSGSVAVFTAKDILTQSQITDVLQGRVAGVTISTPQQQGAPGTDIRIRGNAGISNNSNPLYVVDGVPTTAPLSEITANDIVSITVLKDAKATSLYGSRAANGVIIIETRYFNEGRIKVALGKHNKYSTLTVPWEQADFSVARRFYAPVYRSLKTQTRTDFRETIYWNPVVETNEAGTAQLEFYNSDATTTFRAIAEGIGWNGKPGRTESTWATENPIQLDAKIPDNLTVGDKAMIPLVIKNNGLDDLILNISLGLPNFLSAGNFQSTCLIPASTSKQVILPVDVVKAGGDNIKITVGDLSVKESVSLPIKAIERGFPIIKTIAGDQSTIQKFRISNMVPGSMNTSVRIFTTLEGQLLDGIENMLREPHGCFEQTSSSTFPNILILKYLKETGKANKEVEEMAMNYIEAGYKRLISYETQVGGFEWFGHTPPHEALTAYGLLEFMEMSQFLNVDKKLLSRTREFLLSRRDGKGKFLLASGGYDRFASVPDVVANIYIVYALSQAGVTAEIEKEYETAFKDAITSDDDYKLAMMALAASNMKRENDYDRLMYALKVHEEKSGLSAKTSVVNSRDNSLMIETKALYAMALCRAKTPNVGRIALIVSNILGAKTYYGYGSTQATVLALEAIVEYAKLRGSMAESKVTLSVDGSVIQPKQRLSFAEGEHIFKADYHTKEGGTPFSLEVAYTSTVPENSEAAVLKLNTKLAESRVRVGETIRMKTTIQNIKNELQPMSIAKLAVPAGLSVQPWQLKELIDKKEIAYYELFDGYLVIYWMGFAPNEIKTLNLDLKADVPGFYQAKASNCYLYYTPEHKFWNQGLSIEVQPR
ncbi:TonB-dependent receptor plug domain-containing protein [Chitinophaga silvatica]|nr:TonB-dependent receptor plug domain-containing protein [Chitinophaga silvatica]